MTNIKITFPYAINNIEKSFSRRVRTTQKRLFVIFFFLFFFLLNFGRFAVFSRERDINVVHTTYMVIIYCCVGGYVNYVCVDFVFLFLLSLKHPNALNRHFITLCHPNLRTHVILFSVRCPCNTWVGKSRAQHTDGTCVSESISFSVGTKREKGKC